MKDEQRKKKEVRRMTGNNVKIKQTEVKTGFPVVDSMVNRAPSENDPNGSYTGLCMDEDEVPAQDADDL